MNICVIVTNPNLHIIPLPGLSFYASALKGVLGFYWVGSQVNVFISHQGGIINGFTCVKRIINWSSVGSVHDGIVPFLSMGCQVSIRCDNDMQWLKVTIFTHLVFWMTDNLILCRVGRNSDFKAISTFKCSLRVNRAKSLIIGHVGGASWQFRHRKLKFHWLVVRSKSFEIVFRRRVFKPQLVVTLGNTLQVLSWKHYLAIWTQTEIREFFSDQNPFVEICHIESRPLPNPGTAWWPRVQRVDWAGVVVAISLPCPTWQLCKARLSSRM